MNKVSVRQVVNLRGVRQLIDSLLLRLNTLKVDHKIIQDLKALEATIINTTPIVQETNDRPLYFRKNLDYGERETKQADIRGEGVRGCPFGLSIPNACGKAGSAIHRMTPLEDLTEDQRDKYVKGNKVLFAYCKDGKRCPYADSIIDSKNKVDCNYGDTAQGIKIPELAGSPLYPSSLRSVSLDGMDNKPLGYHGDNQSSRNCFLGLFSYLGAQEYEDLIKLAKDFGLL